MPKRAAAAVSEAVSSIASSRLALPGPSATPGSSTMRKRNPSVMLAKWVTADLRCKSRQGRDHRATGPIRQQRGLLCAAECPDAGEQHSDDDEHADEGALPEGVDAEERQAVADHF